MSRLINGPHKEFTKDELREKGFPVTNQPPVLGTISVDESGATVNIVDKDSEIANLEWQVVEAAVAYREAQSQSWIQSEVGPDGPAAKEVERQAGIKLMLLSDDLIAARKKAESD